jgi:teichuronic acid biosynthesis glycosyltransferase TuaG
MGDLISIIMAAYNAEKTIETAIVSVQNQSYKDFELIVIDDCSIDATATIVKKLMQGDSRIKLLSCDANRGVSYCRKLGLDHASGEWIAILDSDDAWAPTKLEQQMLLQRECGGELIYTGSAFMDGDARMLDWTLHVPSTIGFRQLLKQNIISNSSALVRRELYEKHFASGDDMHEDFAIWLSILKEGRFAYGIDEPLLIYRLSSTSKSSNKARAAIMNWNTYRYIGLNILEAIYYECWYIIKGLIKYRHLR